MSGLLLPSDNSIVVSSSSSSISIDVDAFVVVVVVIPLYSSLTRHCSLSAALTVITKDFCFGIPKRYFLDVSFRGHRSYKIDNEVPLKVFLTAALSW